MTNSLKELEYLSKIASKKLNFKVKFISGLIPEQDKYLVTNDLFNISSYGSTKDKALSSAQKEAEAHFMGKTSFLLDFLKSSKK